MSYYIVSCAYNVHHVFIICFIMIFCFTYGWIKMLLVEEPVLFRLFHVFGYFGKLALRQ